MIKMILVKLKNCYDRVFQFFSEYYLWICILFGLLHSLIRNYEASSNMYLFVIVMIMISKTHKNE